MAVDMLRAVDVADGYRSDRNDVVEEFYVPCLSIATRYDRAVGFFTGRALELMARGLEVFVERGGQIRLIASPYLTEEDIQDIRAGYEYREVIANAVARELDPAAERSGSQLARLGLLGRLVAQGRLDIKIAIMHGRRGLALYHEKIGIMADQYGDTIAFTGSLNETGAAFLDNFESIEVFRSWSGRDRPRAARLQEDFEELWAGNTPRLEVLDFPDVARERFVELTRKATEEKADPAQEPEVVVVEQPTTTSPPGWVNVPEDVVLRDYQKRAVEAWLATNGRGMFRMATGTGKTITALAALDQLGRQLRKRDLPLLTVVVVPLLDLVEQWSTELRKFGVIPIKCRDSSKIWEPAARNALAGLRARAEGSLTLVVTNATFGTEIFQRLLRQVDVPLAVIADEAHHLGSEHLRAFLPEHAAFRLALSATPERWFDPVGTDALAAYFGDVLVELGLEQAIQLGALTPYRYVPVPVVLDDDEAALYAELTMKIGAMLGRTDPDSVSSDDNSVLGQLLRTRSQVLGHARGKLPALSKELAARQASWFQLIYCAEGGRPQAEGPPQGHQVEDVLDLVGNQMGLTAHPFTSREDKRERQRLLRSFGTGRDLRVLVSMRCLDEGVDLPDARVAYMLASSSNPRQFIQRRGRILRRAPGKSRAEVIDFVAVPAQDPDLYDIERTLFRREVARCTEFARYADNRGEALAILRPLRDYYQLLDV